MIVRVVAVPVRMKGVAVDDSVRVKVGSRVFCMARLKTSSTGLVLAKFGAERLIPVALLLKHKGACSPPRIFPRAITEMGEAGLVHREELSELLSIKAETSPDQLGWLPDGVSTRSKRTASWTVATWVVAPVGAGLVMVAVPPPTADHTPVVPVCKMEVPSALISEARL